MIGHVLCKKNAYRDSLFLMVINSTVGGLGGGGRNRGDDGTDSNKDIMRQAG